MRADFTDSCHLDIESGSRIAVESGELAPHKVVIYLVGNGIDSSEGRFGIVTVWEFGTVLSAFSPGRPFVAGGVKSLNLLSCHPLFSASVRSSSSAAYDIANH